MLTKIKKIISITLCMAMLIALITVPASADAASNTIIDLKNWDSTDTGAISTKWHNVAADGVHGTAARLNVKANDWMQHKITGTTVANGTTPTECRDQVLSADFFLPGNNVTVALLARNTNTAAITNGGQSGIWFSQYGGIHIRPSGALVYESTEYKIVDSYEPGVWHNITVYYDYKTDGSNSHQAHYFVDGEWKTQSAVNKTDEGIAWVDIITVGDSSGAAPGYVDNVSLRYVDDNSFAAEVTQYDGKIYIDLNEPMAKAESTSLTFTGTVLTDKYTGEAVEYDVISQTRKQMVIKPKEELNVGAQYMITIPEVKGFRATGGMVPVTSTSFNFTAEADYSKVIMDDDCSTNAAVKASNLADLTYTSENGALKITDSGSSARNVHLNSTSDEAAAYKVYGKNNPDIIEASLDFKVDSNAYLGRIHFSLEDSTGANAQVANFVIKSNGHVGFAVNRDMTNPGFFDSHAGIDGAVGKYRAGQWNNLKAVFNKNDKKIYIYINGIWVCEDIYTPANGDSYLLDIIYNTNKNEVTSPTTIYFDNIRVSTSATGVSGAKIGDANVWTKTVGAENTVAEVSFTDAVTAPTIDNISVKLADNEDAENLVSDVAYAENKATLTLDGMVSGKEYVLEVKGVTDSKGAEVVPYTARFTTKPFAITGLKIVDEAGTEITKANLAANNKVYALPTADGVADTISTVIVAQYNDGILTKLVPVETTLKAGMGKVAELEVSDVTKLTLKAFIWDSLSGVRPLCGKASY